MPDVDDWDDTVLPAIKDILQNIGDHLPDLRSEEFPQSRLMAAAYLARLRRLVLGMESLYKDDLPDVMGIVLRSAYEVFITGMWVHLDGDEATARLNVVYPGQMNRIIMNLRIDADLVPSVEGRGVLKVKQMTEAVAAAMAARGEPGTEGLMEVHDQLFGSESTFSVHAGLPAVNMHLDLDGDSPWVRVREARLEAGDGSGKLIVATTLLAMLATKVYESFGLDADRLNELALPIVTTAEETDAGTLR